MTGATGLVGGRLAPALLDDGWEVRALTRSTAAAAGRIDLRAHTIRWDGVNPPEDALTGADAVIHLAGEPIFAGPLTAARRKRVRTSRVETTRRIANAIAELPDEARPATWVSASAVGFYGSRGDVELDEDAPRGKGFLAELCRDWESATDPAAAAGVRVVNLRIGIVLAREGGALPMLRRIFRLGLGGRLGDGRQWVPWIHVDDLVSLIRFVLDDPSLRGPLNAVAPTPVTNAELTRSLARVVRRPALLPAPAFALRAALGDLSGELLGSRRAVPARASGAGFSFAWPKLEAALRAELEPGSSA